MFLTPIHDTHDSWRPTASRILAQRNALGLRATQSRRLKACPPRHTTQAVALGHGGKRRKGQSCSGKAIVPVTQGHRWREPISLTDIVSSEKNTYLCSDITEMSQPVSTGSHRPNFFR